MKTNKKTVKLTESMLRKMIKESVKNVLSENDGKRNFFDEYGNRINKVGRFREGFARVERKAEYGFNHDDYNFVDKEGNLLSEVWFSDAEDFKGGYAKVKLSNDYWCKIGTDGKLYHILWGSM